MNQRDSKRTAPAAPAQPAPTALAPGLLTTDEAAAWLRVSPRTVKSLPLRRVRIGKLVRYDVRDCKRSRTSTATVIA